MSGYRPAGFFLIRTTLFPIDDLLDVAAALDRSDEPADSIPAELLAWATRPEIRRALSVASETVVAALRTRPGHNARLRGTLLRYLSRMTTRPTPFGLFAAVALGTTGPEADVRLAADPVRHVRRIRDGVDPADPPKALRPNDLLVFGEHRYFLAEGRPRALTVAATPFLRRCLCHAAAMPSDDELRGKLAADFPTLSPTEISRQVDRLRDHGLLIPVQPAQPDAAVRVDTALATVRTELPPTVLATAAMAASVMMSLTQQGYPGHLAGHARAFTERYGQRAEVPVLRVLNPELGIGPPNGYTMPPRDHLLAGGQPGQSAMTGLLLGRLAGSGREIELTDADLAALDDGSADPRPPIPSVDVYAQIAADSQAALRRGDWRLVLTGPGMVAGGRTFGRFTDVLGEPLSDRLAAFAEDEAAACPGLVFAELSYPLEHGRLAGIAAHPTVRHYEIPVNTRPRVPAERVLPMNDLVLSVVDDRYVLRSSRLDREVVVTQGHLLSPRLAPNACRFLLDVSEARWRTPGRLSWGAAENSPFLPRVRYRNIVLSRARWHPPGSGLADWLRLHAVDRWVYLADRDDLLSDNRLLVDLGGRSGMEELARQSRLGRRVVLEEALPGVETLWVRDERERRYASEFVIPVRTARPEVTESPTPPHHRIDGETRVWPGEQWTHVKLYGPEANQNKLITASFADLRERGPVDFAYFLRYHDPAPHLRIRLYTRENPNEMLAEVAAWAAELARAELISDFTFVPYEREIARFGGAEILDLAEHAFAADSDLVLRLLRAPATAPWPDLVRCLDHIANSWGLDQQARLRLARALPDSPAAGELFRRHRIELGGAPEPDHGLADAVRAVARRCTELDLAPGVRADIVASLLHLHLNRRGLRQQDEPVAYGLWRRCLQRSRHR